MPFHSLIACAMTAVQTVLHRSIKEHNDQSRQVVELIAGAIQLGSPPRVKRAMDLFLSIGCSPSDQIASFGEALAKLAQVVPLIKQDGTTRDVLSHASENLAILASKAVMLHSADMGYNLYEVGYIMAEIADIPAFEIAEKLRSLSDPKRLDQVNASAWRYAIQRLWKAVREKSACKKSEWLQAIDAVELALGLPVENPDIQRQLYDQLMTHALQLKDTPIAELTPVIVIQAPEGAVPPKLRSDVTRFVLGKRFGISDEAPTQPSHFLACIQVQSMIDDARLSLMEMPNARPCIAWHDITLEHNALVSAVPMGRSLIVDVDRTGEFAMSLVHEIAHAFVLLGPIGLTICAYRSAIHYLEFVLFDLHQSGQAIDPATITPLTRISSDIMVTSIANAQLELAIRMSTFAAVWTPWLEGVSLYIELLCDPAESQNEIVAPFEVVRSLVDFNIIQKDGESEEAFIKRFAQESVSQFESFYSMALKQHSRLRHLAALGNDNEARLYLPGYLIVRSMVDRWEVTLGRRLAPVRAAKLLLAATRYGTLDVLPALDTDLTQFREHCRSGMQTFLNNLANLDARGIELVLSEVASDEKGQSFAWSKGVPTPVKNAEEQAERVGSSLDRMMGEVTAAALGAPSLKSDQGSRDAFLEPLNRITALFDVYWRLNTLLPVGGDKARVLLFDDSSRVAFCPRSYAGLDAAASDGDLKLARYSIRSFKLDNAAEEFKRIRAAFAALETTRAFVTRLIDLVGHPDSPARCQNVPYICVMLGEEWDYITTFDQQKIDDAHDAFRSLVKARLRKISFYDQEQSTLGSVRFLAERLAQGGGATNATLAASNFSQKDTIIDEANSALAFASGQPVEIIANATSAIFANASARHALSNYLCASGMRRHIDQADEALNSPLGKLFLDKDSYSQIRPFRRQ